MKIEEYVRKRCEEQIDGADINIDIGFRNDMTVDDKSPHRVKFTLTKP